MKPTRGIAIHITTTNLDDIHQSLIRMTMLAHEISPESMIEINIGRITEDKEE